MLEQSQNSAPSTPQIVSGLDFYGHTDTNDRRFSSASAQADAQNQMNINKYNNDYNYWLWQQQTAYNDPSQQRKRLEDAGYNPNFASSEQAGNASSPSPSQAKSGSNFLGAYQASISAKAQKLNEINSILGGFNDLVRNIGQGFDMYKTYVTTPMNAANSYRAALGNLMFSRAAQSAVDSSLKDITWSIVSGDSYLGRDWSDSPLGRALLGDYSRREYGGKSAYQSWQNLVTDGEIKGIVKDLKTFERDQLQPKQLKLLEEQIDSLFSRTKFIDTQNDMYKQLKVSGMLVPFALMLLKGLM